MMTSFFMLRNFWKTRFFQKSKSRKSKIISSLGDVRSQAMIDPNDFDLPLEEMSLGSKAPTPASPSWRDLWTYQKEVHPAFHTIPRLLGRFVLLHPWPPQGPTDLERLEQNLESVPHTDAYE
jgi:hypothetical protein